MRFPRTAQASATIYLELYFHLYINLPPAFLLACSTCVYIARGICSLYLCLHYLY